VAVGRGLKALLGGTLVCALVAGCTSANPTPDASEPAKPRTSSGSPSADPVTLTLGVYGPEKMVEAYDALAAAFTAEHPEVKVEVEARADAEDMVASVEDGDAPDVFLMDHDHLARLVEDTRLQPVDGLLEARRINFGDGYQRGGLTAFAANAALQCMPHDVSPVVVYYNKKLVDLKQLGREDEEPPTPVDGWDWETFTAAARKASRGPARGVYIEPSLASLAPFVWSAGGDIVDDSQDPTRLTLSGGDSKEALEQVLALVRDPQVTPTSRELEKQDAVSRFKAGKLGMILGTRSLTPELRGADRLRFDVMPLPSLGRLRTVADMTGYCISSDTEHVEEAADLVAFAVGRKGSTITARTGYVVPSNLEVANSSAFTQNARQPANSFLFNEGVRRAGTMPFAPEWSQLSGLLEGPLNRMFYAPVIDLESLLEEIDTVSERALAPEED
jgi:multiple sugar transport system substrate-binding protein